jgi:riboflavin kinase/FMN adenylyltransferase
MKIIPVSSPETPAEHSSYPISLAIGNFDGVHVGHTFLIKKMLETAERTETVPAVCTFDPLPVRFFGGETPMLTTLPQRLLLFQRLGVQLALVLDFKAFASFSPEAFFNTLLTHFNIKTITVGKDFRFGRERAGDIEQLLKLCKERGVTLSALDKEMVSGVCVSSSHIRKLAMLGAVEEIPKFLGRSLSIAGVVTEGDKIGRTIGFPTINISTANEAIPPAGVYGGRAKLRADKYNFSEFKALIYIGSRPTLNGVEQRIEANLLNYSAWDLYEEPVELEFTQRIRGEARFAGLEELKAQIMKDKEALK